MLNAPAARAVAAEFHGRLEALEVQSRQPVLFHAYNSDFDRPFVQSPPWTVRHGWGPCIMKRVSSILNPGGKWMRLDEALHRLGIPRIGTAHNAESDAVAALMVHEAASVTGARPNQL